MNFNPITIISKAKKNDRKSLNNNDDNFSYPFNMQELILAFSSNPYHSQCIEVKTMNTMGDAFEDDIMSTLEEITPIDSAFTILYKTIKDLILFGNAFWEVTKTKQVFHIPAQTISANKNGYTQEVNEKSVNFSFDELFHFKISTPFSTIYGAPTYLSVLPDIRVMANINMYNERFFQNNAVPDMVCTVTGGALSNSAIYKMQDFFRNKFKGAQNAHKLLVLPLKPDMNAKFEPLQKQSEGAFLDLLKQSITNIIAGHGVPPRLLSIVNSSQLGGTGETTGQMEIFYKTQIAPLQNIMSGLFKEFNKKYKFWNEKQDFNFIPLQYEKEETVSSLLRRV